MREKMKKKEVSAAKRSKYPQEQQNESFPSLAESELNAVNGSVAESDDAMKGKSVNKFNICSVIGRGNKKLSTSEDMQRVNEITTARPTHLTRHFDVANSQTSTPTSGNPIVITPLSPISPISSSYLIAQTTRTTNNDMNVIHLDDSKNVSDDKSVVLYNRRSSRDLSTSHALFDAAYPTVGEANMTKLARRRRSGGMDNFAGSPFATNNIDSAAVLRSPSMQDATVFCNTDATQYGSGIKSARYFDTPTTAAQIVEVVRRNATYQQELTEPIVALAKQLASKEAEIERLRARLNRRSGRAENRCAYYEDELVTARHEVEYTREQMTKLKQKLRQSEAECSSLKEKRDECELKLKAVMTNYELKTQATEQENAAQRKEYNRLRELEESYEKYIDERDWSEKITDTLNAKLDDSERQCKAREREIAELKATISGLTNELAEPQDRQSENSITTRPSNGQNGFKARSHSRKLYKSAKSTERNDETKQGGSFRKTTSRLSTDEQNATLIGGATMSTSLVSTRSSSSTPDSASLTGAPTSSTSGVSSSGMSTIFNDKKTQRTKTMSCANEENSSNSSATVVFNTKSPINTVLWHQCRQQLASCQRRVQFITEMTNRLLNGGRLSATDIMGGSTSESEMEDTHEEDSLSLHNSDISLLHQRLETLHTTLLSTYARYRAQTEMSRSNRDNCQLQ